MLGGAKMMNLQEFIAETLRQIITGVASAQEHAKTSGAYINVPTTIFFGNTYKINPDSLPEPRIIEFDIAVTTSEAKDIQGGMGIFVASLGLGYKAKKNIIDSEISRIKFSIPIILPSEIKPEEILERPSMI